MANLSNTLNGAKITRINNMFRNRPVGVGYTFYTGGDITSGLRLDFLTTEERERNYTVTLNPTDVGKLVDRLFNPNYNMGFFGSNTYSPSERSDYHYEDLLKEHGIKFATWRYPVEPFAGGLLRWFWVRAVNRFHAEHQFSRVIKNFDPSLVEEYHEELEGAE